MHILEKYKVMHILENKNIKIMYILEIMQIF